MPAKLGGRNDLGVALSFLRWVKGWDQETLARSCGTSLQSIKAIEQGVRGASPKTLGPILAGLGVSLERLAEVRALIHRVRDEADPYARLAGDYPKTAPGIPSLAAADLRRELLNLLAPPAPAIPLEGGPSAYKPSLLAASALWERFRACSEPGQLNLAREAAEFHTSGFVELLCEESRHAAGDSAARALHLAHCAAAAAAAVPGSRGWRSRLEGYAGALLANGLRVGGDLNQADQSMSRALMQWRAGAGDDPGLLNAARVLHLVASLRRDQRRLAEAIALLDQALEIDRWGETPALLIGKAKAFQELGQHAAAKALLLRAESQLDLKREPRNLFVVRCLLLLNLCHLGRHAEAELGLPELSSLAVTLGNHLDLLRVEWLQGKIAAGLGHEDKAILALVRVRAAFVALDNAYDVALVTLELAEIHSKLGRSEEVKALALESAPIFKAHGVHREGRQALELFRRSAEEERVTADLVRGILTYLCRSRHDARVRFKRTA